MRMNYLFESHKILKVVSWWLPDQELLFLLFPARLIEHPAPTKRFPQTRAASSLHFLLCVFVVDTCWPHNADSRGVVCGQGHADDWLGLLFLGTWGGTDLPGCFSLCHPPDPKCGSLHIQSPSSKFWKYSIDCTGLGAFSYGACILPASNILFVTLPQKIFCAPFHILHSTSWEDWSYFSSLTA